MIGNSSADRYRRPNIIITDVSENTPGADSVAELLSREDINIVRTPDPCTLMRGGSETYQMLIICDGGLSRPCFELIERVRRFSDIPLMTLSLEGGSVPENREIYRIMGLSYGADCCMDDPCFGKYEFKARIVSMLRRYIKEEEKTILPKKPLGDKIVNGSITVDRRRREVFFGVSRVRLTSIEYGIIEYLMENCGDVCTVEDIYRRVWCDTPYSVRKTVVEHIRRLRIKIEPDPHNPRYIKAVFGKGYKMELAV